MGSELNHITIFAQLTLALVLGGILGFERLVAGKEAGMRTFGIVAIGSCLFVIVGEVMAQQYAGVVNFDPTRLASSVVTGIGFIGAGLAAFRGDQPVELTTAAGLWVIAGVGMACGFGLYYLALAAAVLSLVIFSLLSRVEQRLRSRFGNKVE